MKVIIVDNNRNLQLVIKGAFFMEIVYGALILSSILIAAIATEDFISSER